MFDSKLDFLDYASFGFSGMVKEAVSPEESFSKKQWLNSFGLAGSIFGVGKLVTSPVKKFGNATVDGKAIDEVKNVAESTSNTGIVNAGEGIPKGKVADGANRLNFGKYSTRIDDKVKVIEKDNLPEWISESFTDGNYRTVITEENITFYRTYGGGAKVNGSFVTTNPAGNRINAKINTALLPDWKNTREYEAVIEVPKGQILNIGRVEKQYTKTGALLEGDGDQILLPQGWPSEWTKEIRKVPSK